MSQPNRAPAIAAKLAQAEALLKELDQDTAILSLEEFEGKPGAAKALASHRAKLEAASRQVSELRAATELAERLDREALATAAAASRHDQLAVFKTAMAGRERSMAKTLDALKAFALAYSEYSEATLTAQTSVPAGTVVPAIAMGELGSYGHVFGPCEKLILGELFRIAPTRRDGIGRFVAPFAKSPIHSDTDHGKLPSAISEFEKANAAVVQSIVGQVSQIDTREMTAASAKKEAA
jgi:hypothetical protein